MGELDEEATRALREGFDEETLALFDLLKKDNLEKDIERIKKVAVELYNIVQRKKEIDDWRAKEQTRDAMRQTIHDFLWSLPCAQGPHVRTGLVSAPRARSDASMYERACCEVNEADQIRIMARSQSG